MEHENQVRSGTKNIPYQFRNKIRFGMVWKKMVVTECRFKYRPLKLHKIVENSLKVL